MSEPREIIIKEVAGGTTEKGLPAIIIEFVDLEDKNYRLSLVGGDLDSFESIWNHARKAIDDMKSGQVMPDKKV